MLKFKRFRLFDIVLLLGVALVAFVL